MAVFPDTEYGKTADGLLEILAEVPKKGFYVVLRDMAGARETHTVIYKRDVFGIQAEKLIDCLNSPAGIQACLQDIATGRWTP